MYHYRYLEHPDEALAAAIGAAAARIKVNLTDPAAAVDEFRACLRRDWEIRVLPEQVLLAALDAALEAGDDPERDSNSPQRHLMAYALKGFEQALPPTRRRPVAEANAIAEAFRNLSPDSAHVMAAALGHYQHHAQELATELADSAPEAARNYRDSAALAASLAVGVPEELRTRSTKLPTDPLADLTDEDQRAFDAAWSRHW